MKKILLILLIILGLTLSGCWKVDSDLKTTKTGLIPLDSRPCNTQYPVLLGKTINNNVEIPSDLLDEFLHPGKKEKLWDWLFNNAQHFDKIIIFTNELFNGSLIESRNPDSYTNLATDLKKLENFCSKYREKEIIVVTILPRLLPSQFTELWQYRDFLTEYAQKIDQRALKGDFSLPPIPKNIPVDIVNKYLGLYDKCEVLVNKIISFTDQGLVDHYLIGQDDAAKYGLTNKIVREIKPFLNEKVTFIPGADELTMLALVKTNLPLTQEELNILYTSGGKYKNYYFPYEAQKLSEAIKTKMDYLNLALKPNSLNTIIIHDEKNNINLIKENLFNQKSSYLGIMDIALTNRGDIKLLDEKLLQLIIKKAGGYAGWNTASNTIGTELAHFCSFNYFKNNFMNYSISSQKEAIEAFIQFKFIRIAEDLVYQGVLRDKLNKELRKKNINPYNLGKHKEEAEMILSELYKPYQEMLEKNFIGEYSWGDINFKVEKISSKIELPWPRTFEAKIIPYDICVRLLRPVRGSQ